MTAEEKRQAELRADSLGLNLNEYVRALVRRAVIEDRWPEVEDSDQKHAMTATVPCWLPREHAEAVRKRGIRSKVIRSLIADDVARWDDFCLRCDPEIRPLLRRKKG